MEVIDYDQARAMLNAIPALHDAIAGFFNDHLGKSFAESPAEREMAAFPNGEIIRTAYSQGSILIEVAADHLMALSKTLTEPVETFAPWACVRSVLETCALAAWLLDPALTAEERAKRSFALRFEGLTELSKFLRAVKGEQTDLDAAERRLDELEDDAVACGFGRLQNKGRKRNGVAMLMPSATQLIAQVFDDEPAYRLLSAMTHGHHWALQQLGYTRFENDDVASVYVKLKKHIAPSSVGYLSARAVRAFVRPVWYKSRQNGWDMERLREILESAFNAMRLVPTERFWRTDTPSSQVQRRS